MQPDGQLIICLKIFCSHLQKVYHESRKPDPRNKLHWLLNYYFHYHYEIKKKYYYMTFIFAIIFQVLNNTDLK